MGKSFDWSIFANLPLAGVIPAYPVECIYDFKPVDENKTMRIEVLNSLTDQELDMLLFILNSDPPLPIKEVTPGLILCYKDDMLTFKVSQWGEKVIPEYKHIFDQLMFKISNVRPTQNPENRSDNSQSSSLSS